MKHSRGVKRAAAWLPLAAMAFVAAAGCNKQTQHAPDVWAVVNGKEIKREEVDKYYRTRVNPEGQEPSQEESLSQKLNVLDELINNEILLEKAKKLNLEASDGEVEDKFTELKSPYTEDEFQRRLKDQAMTVEDLKLELRRQLSIQNRLNSGADFAQLAMDYSEDMNTAGTGGDLGFVPESALNQSDPTLKKVVVALKAGQVSLPIAVQPKDGPRILILKLIARESPGLRGISEPQVQQTIRDTLRNRKEQLLRLAYLAIARDGARVANYLAEQVIEAAGKLPEAAKTTMPQKSIGH